MHAFTDHDSLDTFTEAELQEAATTLNLEALRYDADALNAILIEAADRALFVWPGSAYGIVANGTDFEVSRWPNVEGTHAHAATQEDAVAIALRLSRF